MALIDDFKARFPEFPPADVDSVFPFLESSYPLYYGGEYVDPNKEITLQLLGHLFTVESVANQTMGGVVQQDVAEQDAFFRTTKYGQRFLDLIKHDFGARAV